MVVEKLMEVERYSHVMHISSTVTGHLLPELDAWDALRAALPAGTVSGAPKVRHHYSVSTASYTLELLSMQQIGITEPFWRTTTIKAHLLAGTAVERLFDRLENFVIDLTAVRADPDARHQMQAAGMHIVRM